MKIPKLSKILIYSAISFITFLLIFNLLFSQPNPVSAFSLKELFLWPFTKETGNKTTTPTFKIIEEETPYQSQDNYEQRVINVVKKTENSVVSIVASKDLPVIKTYQVPNDSFDDFFGFPFSIPQYYQKQEGTKKQEVSAGSGFIIDVNGYIVTNKHVISDPKAEYTVFLNDGSEYKAKIIAQDPLEDFALIKIEKAGLTPLILGNSDSLSLGQTAIAIGNSLGEFQNTVSLGVVSGLHRSITAQDETGAAVSLTDLIQTDAAINPGNSGGPLLNLNGEVIGINVAMEKTAQNIGFAIPISKIKGIINQAIATGKISVPFIGIRYTSIDKTIKEKYKLTVNDGAIINKSSGGEPGIVKDSPADKAGLKEQDVIISVNKIKINQKNQLSSVIRRFSPGDKIQLEILRDGKTLNIYLTLGSKDSNQ